MYRFSRNNGIILASPAYNSTVRGSFMIRAQHKLETAIQSLRSNQSLSRANRDTILDFLNECAAEGLSPARQVKYLYTLKTIVTKLSPEGFSLKSATEAQLKEVVANINRSSYSEYTKVDFKKAMKKLYKVMNHGSLPKKAAFIRTGLKKVTPVTRQDLFTPEEVRAVVSHLRNIRDKAFVMILYETGARPGELLACKISDVMFNDQGDFIFLKGLKGTPDRTNQLVESGFLLREWLRFHPCGGDPYNPKDPSAPLWVKLEQTSCKNCGASSQFHRYRGCSNFEPMEVERAYYDNLRMNFKRACYRAGIKKDRLRLYSLRHSRITEVSQFMSNQQLCKFAGWKPGSSQFEVYVHLSNDDVNLAIRKHYNIGNSKENEFIACPICGQKNPSNSLECRNCKRPLSLESATKLDNLSEAVRVIAELKEEGKLEGLIDLMKQLTKA